MRNGLVVLWLVLCSVVPVAAQVSVGVQINLPLYPDLVRIQGYPVYYAPRLDSNYFFYDGMYWVYQDDNWYASSWYNGPWMLVGPEAVPVYLLRVPVHYYRHPPAHFRGWRSNAPPRWDEHWGSDWSQRRRGWDQWNRGSAPAPAPLPSYQRRYAGERYPQAEQQQLLQNRNYRYQPRDPEVRKHVWAPAEQSAPAAAPRGTQMAPQEKVAVPQAVRRPDSPPQVRQKAPEVRRVQPGDAGENVRRAAPTYAPPQQRGPAVQEQGKPPQRGAARDQQQVPKSRGQEAGTQGRQKPAASERGPGARQEDDRERAAGGGQERKR